MTTDRQRRVRELFDAALEQPAEARHQFVTAACGGDHQLQDTVGRLLAAHARSVGILDTPIHDRREEAAFRPAEGSYIGPYKLMGEVGSGGMGVVYRALRADEVFQRVCAIKVIRAELSSQRLLQQFRQERQVLGKLDHPNIARIVDGGSTPEGLPYFVMDYVDGPPINLYCSQHELSVPARLALFQQVCAAVQYLHLNGVIHGDLKPPNMLVGNDGSVRLVDFGIASVLSPHDGSQNAIPLMTMGYASVEQMMGKQLTPASDVFSLGVVLYELLAGFRPYTVGHLSQSEALRAMQQPVAPPSASTATVGNPNAAVRHDGKPAFGSELDSIVLRAMHHEPAQRYQSAAELSADISAYLESRPVKAHKNSLLYVARKFVARRRIEVLAALVILLLLATNSWIGLTARDSSRRKDATIQKLQTDLATAQQRLDKYQSPAGGAQSLQQETTTSSKPGRNGNLSERDKLLQQQKLHEEQLMSDRQLQGLRELAEAYRTSFTESVRLWPFMTPARRSLIQQAQSYLTHAEPIATNDPKAREELARAWMYLANIQGNPQTPNLRDREAAAKSISQALRLVQGTPGETDGLQQQVQLAAQQIGAR